MRLSGHAYVRHLGRCAEYTKVHQKGIKRGVQYGESDLEQLVAGPFACDSDTLDKGWRCRCVVCKPGRPSGGRRT